MKYQTQKIAQIYFLAAMLLFLIQVLGGLLAGWIYVSPNFLSEVLPFNIVRMLHTNSLVVWLIIGFMGAAYFLIPEEANRKSIRRCWPISSSRSSSSARWAWS